MVMYWPWMYPTRRASHYGRVANVTFSFSLPRLEGPAERAKRRLRKFIARVAFRRLEEAREELVKLRGMRQAVDGTLIATASSAERVVE